MQYAPPQGDPLSRAFAAYFQTDGAQALIPGNSSGQVEHKGKEYVVLRNVNGVLAVYRIRNDGQLKRLKRWPAGVEDW